MLLRKDYQKGYTIINILVIIAIFILAISIAYPSLNKHFTLNQERKIARQQLTEASIALSEELHTATQISAFNFKSEIPIQNINIDSETTDRITKYYLNINSQRFGPFKYALIYILIDSKTLSIEFIDFNNSDLKEDITMSFENWDIFKDTDQFSDRYGHPIGLRTLFYTKDSNK